MIPHSAVSKQAFTEEDNKDAFFICPLVTWGPLFRITKGSLIQGIKEGLIFLYLIGFDTSNPMQCCEE